MSGFGSPEWFAEAAAAAAAVVDPAASGVDAVIQYTVKGAAEGTLRCHAVIADGVVTALARGPAPTAADISITVDCDTARDILSGAHGAEVAYMNGAMRLEGRHALWLTDLHDLRTAVLDALGAIAD